jgi:hypothetical protein
LVATSTTAEGAGSEPAVEDVDDGSARSGDSAEAAEEVLAAAAVEENELLLIVFVESLWVITAHPRIQADAPDSSTWAHFQPPSSPADAVDEEGDRTIQTRAVPSAEPLSNQFGPGFVSSKSMHTERASQVLQAFFASWRTAMLVLPAAVLEERSLAQEMSNPMAIACQLGAAA